MNNEDNGLFSLPPTDILKQISGLEFLEAIVDGRLPAPPMAKTLAFALESVDYGTAVFTGNPDTEHFNPTGSVHGGYAATLLDSCLGCAIQSTLAPGIGFTTMELKVNLIRPITEKTGPVRASGTVVHAGRRSGVAEGRLVDADGKLLAHGTSTCMIFTL